MKLTCRKLTDFIGANEPHMPLFYLDEWDTDSPQNLLLHGAPGLGKTSAAYIIAEYLGLQVFEYNASDERGIEFIRNKLKRVAQATNLWDGGRLILLDEADGLTKPAQDSLKRIMEKSNCWWILTCNDQSKIIPAIKSRCVMFKFRPYEVKHVRAYIEHLIIRQGISPTVSAEALHSQFGGDLRAIGNHLLSGLELFPEEQDDLDSLALDLAANEWESAHRTMLNMLREGSSHQYIMRRIHEYVKTVGMTSEQLYTFFSVWGDFVLKMNQWDLGSESFIDYFVATLHTKNQNKNKED
jgi:DNA polymerase III delta prime subunit